MFQQTIEQGYADELTVNLQDSGLLLDHPLGNILIEIGDLPLFFVTVERLQSGESNEEVLELNNGLFTFQDQGEQSFSILHETGDRVVISTETIDQWMPEIRNQL
ncbi:hypothetical protein ACQ4M3_01260 [Leptolyngbya sp. AN03gr2]|uniref:hypothetical protein n=1 Tax=unclassified Leptolyngbya TaxID=2650499 RepID=UPI003D31E156